MLAAVDLGDSAHAPFPDGAKPIKLVEREGFHTVTPFAVFVTRSDLTQRQQVLPTRAGIAIAGLCRLLAAHINKLDADGLRVQGMLFGFGFGPLDAVRSEKWRPAGSAATLTTSILSTCRMSNLCERSPHGDVAPPLLRRPGARLTRTSTALNA